MKWTSFILALLAWSGTAAGQDGADLLRTPPSSSIFAADRVSSLPPIDTGAVFLAPDEIERLLSSRTGAFLRLPSIERHLGIAGTALRFTRFELFAAGAKVRLVTPTGTTAVAPEQRRYFIAGTPSEGVGIALDPKSGAVSGYAARGASRVAFSGSAAGSIEVTAVAPPEDEIIKCGTIMSDQPESVRAELATGGFASTS